MISNIPIISDRKDNIMSSSIGVNDSSFIANDPKKLGGALKPSQILGSISGVAGAAGALAPVLAPIAIPVSLVSGLLGSIAGLFGGGLTQNEADMIMQIKSRVDQRRDLRGVTGNPTT